MSITNQIWRFLLLLAFLSLVGCERRELASTEPARPSNVPATSIWVGGLDGGVFVVINKSRQNGNDKYHGEIYYASGDIAYKGPLRIIPEGTVDFDSTKQESYEGWDGDTLYLSKNRRLETRDAL